MRFPKLTLRLVIGYLLMVGFTVLIGAYALFSLHSLQEINQSMIEVDLPLVDTINGMIETVNAQDLYARKYAILKDETTEGLFRKRSEEFEDLLSTPAFIKGGDSYFQLRLRQLHDEYNELFDQEVALVTSGAKDFEINQFMEGPFRIQMETQIRLLKRLERQVREAQQGKFFLTNQRIQESWMMTVVISIASLGLGLGFASFATYRISRSIQQLKEATKRIAQGEFDRPPPVEVKDVVGDLTDSISWMSRSLKELGEMKLDASPLTQLPGNKAVERELIAHLSRQMAFAFAYADLKDFKAYSDRYGFVRGSDVIMQTGQILSDAVSVLGDRDDFVGHIGGDDFVVITRPERIQRLSEQIIKRFDEVIPSYYDEEDLARGYIVSRDRNNNIATFPIMTISISVVINEGASVKKTTEVGEMAAALKRHAKTFERSTYIIQKQS